MIIILLFLGHSVMECDSVHAAIEREASKRKCISVSSEWREIIAAARKSPIEDELGISPRRRIKVRPYQVIEMTDDSFWDFSKAPNYAKYFRDEQGSTIGWSQPCWFRYEKNILNSLQTKSNFDGSTGFRYFSARDKENHPVHLVPFTLVQKYSDKIPIPMSLKRDLLELIKLGAIPERYRTIIEAVRAEEKPDEKCGNSKK